MASTLSLKYIEDKFIPAVASSHAAVMSDIIALGSDGDIEKMLKIQIVMQGYTSMTELTGTCTKSVGDMIKGIVQKSG